jgi:VanZ family protein
MPAQYSKEIQYLFWTALITSYILAILPQDMAPEIGNLSDKTLHFIAFAVLALLLNLSYRIPWWKSAGYLLFYAFFIEASQYFTPNRCAELLDIAADAIGIGIGLLFYAAYKKLESICANS